ncbi:MAG: hypothetical protein U9N36_09025 [Euryarchaeota archaeon]|nr:hypothetical protein [Euryarchaeota archaeon]
MESLTVTLTDTDLSTLDDFIGSIKFSDRSETVKLAIGHPIRVALGRAEEIWFKNPTYHRRAGNHPCRNPADTQSIPPRDVKINESVSGYEYLHIRYHWSAEINSYSPAGGNPA